MYNDTQGQPAGDYLGTLTLVAFDLDVPSELCSHVHGL
jgi:hypothetical protein